MAYLNIYLRDDEHAWVKRQREGVVRKMVQTFMEAYPDLVPEEEFDEDTEEED